MPARPALKGSALAGSTLAAALAVAAITLLVFLPTLRNDFVNFDDRANLIDNPRFRGFGLAELRWMVTTFHLGHWQPLSWLSFAVDYRLWGLDPRGYHLTNLLLHATAAGLAFVLAERLLALAGLERGERRGGAAIAALLWAIHPLRVESVAWATERRDVLCGVFTLLALLAYLAPAERRARLPAVLLAMTLAAMAKASAMVLPALFFVLDVYPLRRLGGSAGPGERRVWLEKVPIVLLGVVAGGLAIAAQRHAGALAPLADLSAAARAGAAMYGLGFYLWKTVAPLRLMPMYEFPPGFGALHPWALAGALVAGTAAVLALLLRRRCPALLAALVAYAVTVAPTLGLAQSGFQLVADRYSYLPALGPSVVVGGLVAAWLRPARALLLAAPVVLVLGLQSALRVTAWHDGRTLWSRALATDPANAFAHSNLGDIAFHEDAFGEAAEHFRRAVALRPDFVEAHHDLALTLAQLGQFADAADENREAARLRPRFAAAYASLGVNLANLDRDGEAIAAYRQALAIDPKLMETHANLGMLLGAAGRVDEALAEYREALRLERSVVVLNNAALLLANAGRPAEAVGLYREALQLRPEAVPVHENLAYALVALGDRAGAVAALEQALRIDPSAEEARQALAQLNAAPADP